MLSAKDRAETVHAFNEHECKLAAKFTCGVELFDEPPPEEQQKVLDDYGETLSNRCGGRNE